MLLRTFLILSTLLLTASGCVGQADKGKVLIEQKRNFGVPAQGRLKYTLGDSQDTITARILINGDTISQINFAKGEILGETVRIIAYGLNEATHDNLVITISGTNYKMAYSFAESGVEVQRTLKVKRTRVVLNDNEFKKGSVLKGYIEYEATCENGCASPDYVIKIEGNFHAKLR